MERATVFQLAGDSLLGILHPGAPGARLGVLVVVGGPQYRVGSHRQFVLLARHLAEQGIPVFRFDYRGMGDASGEFRDFEQCGEDLAAALDEFQRLSPGLENLVVWGLCDAASAALMFLADDPRVAGMVLVNPWVRSEQGLARAQLKHYYVRRLVSRDFWAGLLGGRRNPMKLVTGLLGTVVRARRSGEAPGHPANDNAPFSVRMARGWARFPGDILLVISGNDLTAAEFLDLVAQPGEWQALLRRPNVTRRDFPDANHTFSSAQWRDELAHCTAEWIRERFQAGDAKCHAAEQSLRGRG